MIVPNYIYIALIAGILSIIMALVFAKKVMKADPGNERMVEVAGYIESGSITFIKRQYTTLAIFVAVIAVALLFIPSPLEDEVRSFNFMNWEQSMRVKVPMNWYTWILRQPMKGGSCLPTW